MVAGKVHRMYEMASNQFNNLLKTTLSLNPQVLSKTTNKMVNTCIEKIYQEGPNNFRNDLQKIKTSLAKEENREPIRDMQEQEHKEEEPKEKPKTVLSNVSPTDLLKVVMPSPRKPNITRLGSMDHKFYKSRNYKIYKNRHYGSSASNYSFSKRNDALTLSNYYKTGRDTKKCYIMAQSGGKSQNGGSKSHVRLHQNATAIAGPARNQVMKSSSVQLQMYANIQKDLKLNTNSSIQKPQKVIKINPDHLSYPHPTKLMEVRNEQVYAHNELCRQNNIQSKYKPKRTYEAIDKKFPNSPSLNSKIIRKRLVNICTKPVKEQTPARLHFAQPMSSVKYFANRQPMNSSADTKELTINNDRLKTLQKVTDRVVSPSNVSLSTLVSSVPKNRDNRMRYLNLTTTLN